ncbi:hypothetical protein [Agrobacterium rosae]|uniref:hypothetical protein n=1 Tax=Agrobacterium rosae TaxID=1972867 RepID=UPI003A806ED3
MDENLALKFISRWLVVLAFRALLLGLASTAQATDVQVFDQKRAIADGVFDGDQAGMFLWLDTKKFCAPLKEALSKTYGDDTALLYSDEKQTKFYAGRCEGSCSLSDETKALGACQAETGQSCLLYAAIRKGISYDLTVSANGKSLSHACETELR